jgi:hypothetical protein
MDREEAQNILQLCRPDNLEDRNDPLIADALELLSQDAELSTWFDEQQALDTEISAEFSKIEPPADLKASILVGMRAHAAQSELLMGDAVEEDEEFDHSIPFPRPANSADHRSWLRPLMSIAAIFVVAGIILVLPRGEQPAQLANSDASAAAPVIATAGVPNVIEFLAQQISEFNGSKFDKRGESIGELQSHLASTGMPNPASIPGQLGELETLGCVTFDYEGTKLSMICFKNGQVYHLITASKATFPKDCAPNCSKAAPKFFETKQQAFKIWSEGEQIFILTTQGTEEDIPDFI